MKCAEYKRLLSPYLDGQVSGAEMFQLQNHMKGCPSCAREYAEVQRTMQMIIALNKAKAKAPADLPLKLRLAISKESKQARRRRFEGAMVRLRNTLDAFMVPVTAGAVSAILIFGILLGFFALPQQLQASSSDVPLMLYVAPQLKQSVFGTSLGMVGEDSVVVEAYIDANGRVEDYRILSESDDNNAAAPQVKNLLIFTTFSPALSMGVPIPSRAVISFSKISVKG
ncbi:MAG TPA: zf-HC2 domain-containing protein [Terriglobales bacterium]|nr:zf-HC2 domain-containing protein [Terriglobales bacterium]